MSILTEKEREDVYKYWLHSSTLTNEDGLIQLAEKAVLEKLAGMELPGARLPTHALGPMYNATQLHQAFAQGAASQLSGLATASAMPGNDAWTIAVFKAEDVPVGAKIYTLKAPK